MTNKFPFTIYFIVFVYCCGVYTDTTYGQDCGIVNTVNHYPKIVGGLNLTVDYPWYVAFAKLKEPELTEWLVYCGGALVTDMHVVTASHCFGDQRYPGEIVEKRFKALFGLKNQCSLEGQPENIRKVYLHKKYIPNQIEAVYDIALVALARSVPFTPICLPSLSTYSHQHGIIIGFGGLTPRSSTQERIRIRQLGNPIMYPCYIREATIIIFTAEECKETEYGDRIPPNVICAGLPEGGADSCDGDSGGPLMVEVNGRMELVGVISYGTGCGRKTFPGIYSDVTQQGYLSWITKHINYDVGIANGLFPSNEQALLTPVEANEPQLAGSTDGNLAPVSSGQISGKPVTYPQPSSGQSVILSNGLKPGGINKPNHLFPTLLGSTGPISAIAFAATNLGQTNPFYQQWPFKSSKSTKAVLS